MFRLIEWNASCCLVKLRALEGVTSRNGGLIVDMQPRYEKGLAKYRRHPLPYWVFNSLAEHGHARVGR